MNGYARLRVNRHEVRTVDRGAWLVALGQGQTSAAATTLPTTQPRIHSRTAASMGPEWLGSAHDQRVLDNLLTWQLPNSGWPANYDASLPRQNAHRDEPNGIRRPWTLAPSSSAWPLTDGK